MGTVERVAVLLAVVALCVSVSEVGAQQLQYRFYRKSCPKAESIIFQQVQRYFKKDPTVAPGLLRLIFHDCFVRGCDASVLMRGRHTERTSSLNARLHGFEVIDAAKHYLEKACPNTVSCADILAYASRDAVALTGGPCWKVYAGRRDGLVSKAIEVEQNLPLPSNKASDLVSIFAQKGINTQQMVVLSGAHTLGVTHCNHLSDRIFSPVDRTMPKDLLKALQQTCPKVSSPPAIVLDLKSVHKFDTAYYENLKAGRGLMTSDQDLWTDESTRQYVIPNLKQSKFVSQFANAMLALTSISPTFAPEGEIRKRCQYRN